MTHRIPVAAVSVGVLIGVTPNHARAQMPVRQPVMLVAAADTTGGRVHGFVRDAAGAAVADARVLAVGQTIVSARSDLRGRFQPQGIWAWCRAQRSRVFWCAGCNQVIRTVRCATHLTISRCPVWRRGFWRITMFPGANRRRRRSN